VQPYTIIEGDRVTTPQDSAGHATPLALAVPPDGSDCRHVKQSGALEDFGAPDSIAYADVVDYVKVGYILSSDMLEVRV